MLYVKADIGNLQDSTNDYLDNENNISPDSFLQNVFGECP